MTNGSGTLPEATVGQAYSVQLVVPGLPAGDIYGLDGSLPLGLSLNQSTGLISGTPELPQSSVFTVSPNGPTFLLVESLSLTVSSGVALADPTLIPIGNEVAGLVGSGQSFLQTLVLDLPQVLNALVGDVQWVIQVVEDVIQCQGLPTPTCGNPGAPPGLTLPGLPPL